MTVKEVAKLARVSTATVSYVINGTQNVTEEKRQRVLDAISQLGYQPNHIAQSLRLKSTNTIGVLVEDITGFSVPAIINGISEYTEKNGYQILLNDLRMLESLSNHYEQIVQQKNKINEAISLLLHGARVDAIIYIGTFDREITGIINKIHKPLVIAYSTTADPGACYVAYDSENISAEVIRYFLQHSHRHIAVITGPPHTFPSQMRMRGVQKAFDEAGIILKNSLIQNGDWEYSSGYHCMRGLLEQEPRPTALFAMNDLMAAGAMDAIHDAGLKVPEDISVIGFDNREIASYLRPQLTTVEINLKEIGRTAAEMALNQIKGKQIEKPNIIVPSRLVLRKSVTYF